MKASWNSMGIASHGMGELDSRFGGGAFRIDAVVDGDTMQGTNEVPRAGRYRFVAVRAK